MSASGVIYDLLSSESSVRWAAGPVGSPVTISYSFPTSEPAGTGYPGFTPFSAAEQDAARAALAYIASFTRITFVETAAADADIRFGNADLSAVNAAGITSYTYGSALVSAQVFLANNGANPTSASSFVPGDL